MRYRFIAVLAIAVMLLGVMGIYTNNAGETPQNIDDSVELVYFVARQEIHKGDITEGVQFVRKTSKYSPSQIPEELEFALGEQAVEDLLAEGAIAEVNIAEGQVLTANNIKSLPEKLDAELIAFPLSVSTESVFNPKVGDQGFVDLFLISNDNKIYRDDLYQKRGGGISSGKDYKDTRVKKFASNVWIVKTIRDRKNKPVKASLLNAAKADATDAGVSKFDNNGNVVDTRIVYAYFNKDDIDSVIQAQVLGMFFVSPVTVTKLNNPLASISTDAREITAADIVSGAPLAEKKIKVVEIRGAKKTNDRN